MKSIKNSYSECSSCDLLDMPSCIIDTNCKANLNNVDIVIISDIPDKTDMKKDLPLSGNYAKTYRDLHNKYLNKGKWLITNCVLCCDEKLDDEKIILNANKCRKNFETIIDKCEPKLILLLGSNVLEIFGLGNSISTKRGKFYKWNNYDVLVCNHPKYINQNKNVKVINDFEGDIKLAAKFIGCLKEENVDNKTEILENISMNDIGFDRSNNSINTSQSHKTGVCGIHYYKIPEKFYTDEYRLIDIQYAKKIKQIIYIFRDKNNNKIYHTMNDDYYCYEINQNDDTKKIVPYDKLQQIKLKYEDKSSLNSDITYEGDMKLTAKHAIDYYHFNKGECQKTFDNICYIDIEIDLGLNNQSFPDPTLAKYPINLITTKYNGVVDTYLLVKDNNKPTKDFPGVNLFIFKSEKQLLESFIKKFKENEVDFLSGWNSIPFDLLYIYNRLKNLNINPNSISKFNEFYVDGNYGICNLVGTVVIDQLTLYKNFVFKKRENYKLANIAQIELNETKIILDIPFNEVYYKQLDKFIEYNIQDTVLLEKLENKLKHINLLNEIRLICNTSFQAGSSVLGQIDSLMVSFLKSKNLASKNSNPDIHKESYPGAFVYEPIPGIYNNIADFDFTSLYPSLIITYNIGVNSYIMKFVDPHMGYDFIYHPENLPDTLPIIIDPMYKNENINVKKDELIKRVKEDNIICTINGCFFKNHEKERSVYSEVLQELLSSRKTYKKKMLVAKEDKDTENVTLYNTKQLVYKVLANSMYGAIANKTFRFFDVSCAGAITLSGQEALKTTIFKAEEYLEHMNSGKDIVKLPEITKEEMYSDHISRRCSHIITGDTDSIFVCFQKFKCDKSSENISKLCNEIQDYLNNIIIPEVTILHNVPNKENRLFLKNELVISRGLFLAKKRYAIQVDSQEGKKVDETVYMGLEIKRSDFASETKIFLKELLDLILKSEVIKLNHIFDFIAKKEKHFIQLIKSGDKRISRPVSFTKDIKSYKVISQGVRSMIAWNEIIYNIHVVGTRAYMFKIMGIDENIASEEIMAKYRKYVNNGNKLDVISIPDEENKLPDYFIVDLKEMLKFCFTDRYESILKPLMTINKNKSLLQF